MNVENMKILLQEKENLTLEFKEKYSSKIDEDMVAFANTKGGVILLGVDDAGKIVGQELSNDLKAKINSIARNCKPSIGVNLFYFEKVVAIEVLEGKEKPYSCSSGYYKRFDATSQKMSQEEIRIIFQENDILSFEEKTSKKAILKDLSQEKVNRYLKEARISKFKQNMKEILISANVLKNDYIKNAGILFFAKKVTEFIPNAKIDLIRFKGIEKSFIFDRLEVKDDLLTQFDQAMFFLKKHLNTRSEIRGVNRFDILEIPEEVLREAVANALIHRDYNLLGTNISVEIYDDKVVIINPGGLPKGLSVANFGKVSIRRNELIADLFYRMQKVERAGTGINKMKNQLALAGLVEPKFEFGTFFIVTFKRDLENVSDKTRVVTRVKTREKIISLIRENSQITSQELSEITYVSIKGIEWQLKKLKSEGLIKRIGPDKGGRWEVKK